MNTTDTINNDREGIDNILSKESPFKSQVILFGSRARGDARDDSNWDLLILLNKNSITQSDIDEISYSISKFGWEIDAMVKPNYVHNERLELKKVNFILPTR